MGKKNENKESGKFLPKMALSHKHISNYVPILVSSVPNYKFVIYERPN